MTGYNASLIANRYGIAETSVLMLPRRVDPTRCAIIYAHGAGGKSSNVVDGVTQKAITRIMAEVVRAGFVVLSGDWGGAQTYGNDAEMAAMDAGWEWLRNSGLCRNDKVILSGGSMGFMSILRWAADNESEVAGINGWIPAIDIEEVRNSNALGLRDLVNAAWGLAAGSYQALDGTTVPHRGNPLLRASELNYIPTHVWYSTGDTATKASSVNSYALARSNVVRHVVSTTLDHSDEAIAASDTEAIIHFFKSVAKARSSGVQTFAELDGNIAMPIVSGHRGDVQRRAESALGSYNANASEWPVPHLAFEADIGMTSDGSLIVMHDDDVDRTTDGTGLITSLTAAQIAALNVKNLSNYGVTDNPPLKVPTVQQYLNLCKTRIGLIEPKATNVSNSLVPIIQAMGVSGMILPNAFSVSALQPFINAGLPVMLHDPQNSGMTPQQLKAAGVTHINWRATNVPTDVDTYLAAGLKVWSGGTSRYEWAYFCGRRCGGISDDAMWTSGVAPVLSEDAFDSGKFLPGHLPYTAGIVGALINRGDGVKAWAPGFVNTSGIGDQGNGWTLMGHLSPHPNSRTAPWNYATGFGALPANATYPWGYEFDVTYLEAGSTPTRRWGIALGGSDRPFHDTTTGSTTGYGVYVHGDQTGTVYAGAKNQGSTRLNAISGAIGPTQNIGQTVRWRVRRKSATQIGITCLTTAATETNVTLTSSNPELYQGGYLWLGNPGVTGSTGRWAFSNILAV